MDLDFVYGIGDGRSDIILFTRDDIEAEDYASVGNRIAAFPSLFFARGFHKHPFAHKESRIEEAARTNFKPEEWLLVAAELDPNSDIGYSSAFIVNRKDTDFAYVLELKGCQIVEAVYGTWGVKNFVGGVDERVEVLRELNAENGSTNSVNEKPQQSRDDSFAPSRSWEPNRKKKPGQIPNPTTPKPRVQEDPEPEEDAPVHVEIERPAFVAGSSGKPGRIKGPSAPEKKPAPAVEPEEEPAREPVEIQRPAFVAGSSKKPPIIGGPSTPPKPASQSVEEEDEEEETPNIPVTSAPFVPFSSAKPKKIGYTGSTWHSRPFYSFLRDSKNTNSRLLVFGYADEGAPGPYANGLDFLGRFKSLSIHDYCMFIPKVPEGSFPLRQYFKKFDVSQWRLLSMNIDAYNRPITLLLSLREDPKNCIVVSDKGLIYAISFRGVSVNANPYISFDDLLHRFDPPLQRKPSPERSTVSPVVKPKPVKESQAKPAEIRKPCRRVFATNGFFKDRDRFVRKYHLQAEEDFDAVIQKLLTVDNEGLEAFLRSKDSKPIRSEHGVTIYKFRFGSSNEYEAARLFYCRGYDLTRHMGESDFLLLGLTGQDEHDDQTEASELFAAMFRDQSELVLTQLFLPAKEGGEIDELAYMSAKQFDYLRKAGEDMPMAFLGSAGTGKTLISLWHYLSLRKEGRRVLYLTYQKELCAEVKKKLHDLEADDVEAMTYRELCTAILGEDASREMRTKKRYRKWFFDTIQRDPRLQRKIKAVGPTEEDQFMICYVFYRGVIDGSRVDFEKRQGRIITREQFLEATKNEEGISHDAKDAIYEIALAYERHLTKHQGTTDNKLAYRIHALGKRAQRYDAIVIDEFQDLSEVQFLAILSLLKPATPLPLFIYGDEDQAINPTIFSFNDAKQILREHFGPNCNFALTELNDSYRSGPNLVHYINDINRVKRLAIGARSIAERQEVSLRLDEEDLFSTLVEGERNLKDLVEICSKTKRGVAFIFPSVLRKETAAKKYERIAKELVETSFFSVEESKGIEWDSVVLVDFFSSSLKLFETMIGEERSGKHSTVHRMLFNRFYVALTRGRNRVVVYESHVSKPIREKLLAGLTPLADVDSLRSYFLGMADDSSWYEFGLRLFQARKYRDAYKALSKVETPEARELAALCHGYIQAEREETSYEDARDFYLSQLDFTALSDLYEERGEFDLCRYLDLATSSEDDTYLLEAYRAIYGGLSALEKQVFFSLLARKICARANEALDSLIGGQRP